MNAKQEAPSFAHGIGAFRTPQPASVDGLPPDKRLDRHQDLELNLVEGGEYVYLFGARPVVLGDGELTVFWGAQPHQVLRRRDVRCLSCIHVPLSWVLAWDLPAELIQSILDGTILHERDPARHPFDRELMKQWVSDVTCGREERRDIALLEIQARLRRLADTQAFEGADEPASSVPDQAPQDRALGMARHIAEHYAGPLPVAEVAAAVGLHPDYAMTLFKQTFGFTMTQFINQHRVWRAQRLLATTQEKVLTIALESGFGSLSQFNTVFKQVCGKSPRDFRRSLG